MRVHAAVSKVGVGDARLTSAEAHVGPLRVGSDHVLGDPVAEHASTELDKVVHGDSGAERLTIGVSGGEPAEFGACQVLILSPTRNNSVCVPGGAR